MAEYVAYYESSAGQYLPIVAIFRSDGNKDFREMTKEDISQILDPSEMFAGWLYKNSQSLKESWTKRFMILRGSYLFFFHNPQNERPIGVIPLENCDIICPHGNAPSFTDNSILRKTNGFEFAIRHNSRKEFVLYAQTDSERNEWLDQCAARTGRMNNTPIPDSHSILPSSSFGAPNSANRRALGKQNVAITTTSLPPSTPSPQRAPHSPYVMDNAYLGASSVYSNPPPPFQGTMLQSTQFNEIQNPSSSNGYGKNNNPFDPHNGSHSSVLNTVKNHSNKLEYALADSRYKDEEMKKQSAAERSILERDLQEKMKQQQEGRKREALARERGMSKHRVEAAKIAESKNPMTLSEMFRCLLFFVNEALVEEPQPDTPLQFPHLKGAWAESMLVSVYQKYCRSSGYMSLEEFVEFMEDSAILNTHVPHDDNDEPLQEYQAQLDPVRLLTTVPKNLGYSREMESALSANDSFCLNFAQFYQLLLRISHVVYPELHHEQPCIAMNKLLQESILPLYAWSQGHAKRGSVDELVKEERVVLILATYAPNIWKVFLMYCQDCKKKVPELGMPYPDAAKRSEKVLFGVPYNAPYGRSTDEKHPYDNVGYFVSESACVRFFSDYGLIPHLVSKREMKEMFQACNRQKTLELARTVRTANPPTVFFQKTQTALRREQEIYQYKPKEEFKPMHFSGGDRATQAESRATGGGGATKRAQQMAAHLSDPTAGVVEAGGLGFSEFIELISRVAQRGMSQEGYNVLFPTTFSQVIAILTVWGVADLHKLEEVRALRSDEIVE